MKSLGILAVLTLLTGCTAGAQMVKNRDVGIITDAPANMDSQELQKQERWRAYLWARANTTVGTMREDFQECGKRPRPSYSGEEVAGAIVTGLILGPMAGESIGDRTGGDLNRLNDCMVQKGYSNGQYSK